MKCKGNEKPLKIHWRIAIRWKRLKIKSLPTSVSGISLVFPSWGVLGKGWSLLSLNSLYRKDEKRRHDSFYQMRLCIKFQNIVKYCVVIIISLCPVIYCTLFSQNVIMIYSFYSFMCRLETNIVLDSLDRTVTFYAPPIREADKNIIGARCQQVQKKK